MRRQCVVKTVINQSSNAKDCPQTQLRSLGLGWLEQPGTGILIHTDEKCNMTVCV